MEGTEGTLTAKNNPWVLGSLHQRPHLALKECQSSLQTYSKKDDLSHPLVLTEVLIASDLNRR